MNNDKRFIPSSIGTGKRLLICFAAYAIYGVLFLTLQHKGGIATNYMIIFPIIVASVYFGLWGGILSGTFGLSCNLALFSIRDALCYAPENLIVAQISGVVIGTGLGLAGTYFESTGREIEQRKRREDELNIALGEKEILYKELNHRVKNNLNIMKSLIQLQMNRSESREFIREGYKLINRILSISLVHEQLYSGQLNNKLNLRQYLGDLIRRILAGYSAMGIELSLPTEEVPLTIPLEKAIPVGLIINEVVTNSVKYAFEPDDAQPSRLFLRVENCLGGIRVEVEDNGKGFSEEGADEGLGTTLIRTLTRQLQGEYSYLPRDRGSCFALTIPL